MKKVTQIIIDLPAELLSSIDEQRGKTTPSISRSEFIHLALLQYLRTESESSLEAQYIRGYLEHPETEEELADWVEQASMAGLREFYKDEPPWPDSPDSNE